MKRWLPLLGLLLGLGAVAGVAVTLQRWPLTARPPRAALPSASVSHQPLTPPSAEPNATEDRSISLTLYFPNRQYVETGDDTLARLLPERTRLPPESADARGERLASVALGALAKGPSSAAALPAIPERVTIRGVRLKAGIAEVDLIRSGLSGSSLEEQLLVGSIVQTLVGLPDVRAVRFLIEGNATETLMGHINTSEPLAAEP